VAYGVLLQFVLFVLLVVMCVAFLTSTQIYMALERANEQTTNDN